MAKANKTPTPPPGGSSDDGAGRITPDLLREMLVEQDVAGLARSERDAWTGNTALAGRMAGEFGTVTIPIVDGGQVLYGWEYVQAEQQHPTFGGKLLTLDITNLGWPAERVWALVTGLRRQAETTTVDHELLAELLTEINEGGHSAWLEAAGWEQEHLDALLFQAPQATPTLDSLEAQWGAPTEADYFQRVTVKGPMDMVDRWVALTAQFSGEDHELLTAMMALWADHTGAQ